MRDSARSWCRVDGASDPEDPAVDLGPPPEMSGGECGGEWTKGAGAGFSRPSEPDAGVPGHVGAVKQLHSGTGYNLTLDCEGSVFGTREPFHPQAVLRITARDAGEVQIQGAESGYYVAMDENGTVYAERDYNSPNTWFKELYQDGWNYYQWLGNDEEWYLGINKNGNMKPGHKTKVKQKSVKFVPRAAEPS